MLALAAEIGDGAFTNFLPFSGLPKVVGALREGERAAGRREGSSSWPAASSSCPAPPEEGVAFARHMFAAYASVPVYAEFFRWLGWGDRIDPMVQAYTAGDRAGAAALAPEELIREIFILGRPLDQHRRLLEFAEGGIDTLVLTFIAPAAAIPELIDDLSPRAWR